MRTPARTFSTPTSTPAVAAVSRSPAELPLLYPKARRATPPDVRFPPPVDDDQPGDASPGAAAPKREWESKLEPQPFLESLPVYRYARP